MSTLMAFDTSYLYYRAFFGVPASMQSPDGHPVNAIRGTLDFITRLAGQYSPDHLVCAWDDDWRPNWRVELVPSYKTHRVADSSGEVAIEDVVDDLSWQIPHIRACLEALGIPVVGAPDHEADDVLASLAARHDGPSLIVTGDRDLFQLVDDEVSVVYVAGGVAKHVLVTPEYLATTYGLPAGRYVDFAVLRGDPSDGLPGVKGIGDKSAATLVNAYPTLEAMLAAAADPAQRLTPSMRTKLLGAAEYLPKARTVVTAVKTLELTVPETRPVDQEHVSRLGETLGLGGSLTRLAGLLAA